MAHAQNKITLTVGDNSVTATLADNSATRALLSLLATSPVSVSMDDYGGFEKVGALPQQLPTSDTRITTVPGDIMLYQGRNIVIFYGSNTWSYTPLGKIDLATADDIRQFLGVGNVELTVSAGDTSGIEIVAKDRYNDDVVYDIKGRLVEERPLHQGLYIVNGKKTLIR
ncbi:MAG: hypothetical protein K2M98_01935 [Muribaculum sp.]|nr:hypothetical protein [Muribaculum sp.]